MGRVQPVLPKEKKCERIANRQQVLVCRLYARGMDNIRHMSMIYPLAGTFSMSTSGGYHQYIGGNHARVHLGDIMSTSGDVQYIGGIS